MKHHELVGSWKEAVANDATTVGLHDWIKEWKNSQRYVCAVSHIMTYIYVDLETKQVVRVIASDESLPVFNEMDYFFADKDFVPQTESLDATPTIDEVDAAQKIMGSAVAWPGWEWSW